MTIENKEKKTEKQEPKIYTLKLTNGETVMATSIEMNTEYFKLQDVVSLDILPETGQLLLTYWHSYTQSNQTVILTKNIMTNMGNPSIPYIDYYNTFVSTSKELKEDHYVIWKQNKEKKEISKDEEQESDSNNMFDSLKSVN